MVLVERARAAIGKGANEPQLEGAGAQVSEEAAKSKQRRGRKERSQRLRDERRWLACLGDEARVSPGQLPRGRGHRSGRRAGGAGGH